MKAAGNHFDYTVDPVFGYLVDFSHLTVPHLFRAPSDPRFASKVSEWNDHVISVERELRKDPEGRANGVQPAGIEDNE